MVRYSQTFTMALALMLAGGTAAAEEAAATAAVTATTAAKVAAPVAAAPAPAAAPAAAASVSATATAPVAAPAKPKLKAKPKAAPAADGAAAPAEGEAKAKPAPAPKVSKEDIDLWAFLTINASAPGKTLADFRALPNLTAEKKDELRGTVEDNAPQEPSTGPVGYRFTYANGLEVRVLDYGQSAFVTRIRINGPDRVIKDELKIGSPRDQIEAVLGRSARGGGTYAVYEGKTDVVRVYYTPTGTIASVEVQHDS